MYYKITEPMALEAHIVQADNLDRAERNFALGHIWPSVPAQPVDVRTIEVVPDDQALTLAGAPTLFDWSVENVI